MYTRTPASFASNYIFKTFCPYCSVSTTADIYLTLTDSYGDGWEGNQLAVQQDTSLYVFGKDFLSGHEYNKTLVITLKTGTYVQIVPYVYKLYTE